MQKVSRASGTVAQRLSSIKREGTGYGEGGFPMRYLPTWLPLIVAGFLLVACRQLPSEPSGGSVEVAPVPPERGATDATHQLPVRQVIREAELRVTCEDYRAVGERLQQVVLSFNGYVRESDFAGSQDSSGPRQMTLIVWVPNERLEEFLATIRQTDGIKRIEDEWIRTRDVTEETLDLTARRRSLERSEARLQDLLTRAQTVDEVLRVDQALREIHSELERLTEQERLLARQIRYAEVRFLLVPAPHAQKPGLQNAWQTSLELLGWLVGWTVWTTVLLWWLWLPLFGTLLVLVLFVRRHRRRSA